MIEIRKALEMGAEGVIIPHVRTIEEMETCVSGAKFPPLGRRGFDVNVRAAQYGFDMGGVEFYEEANRTELVIPMAEDFEFTDQLDAVSYTHLDVYKRQIRAPPNKAPITLPRV